MPSSDQGAPPRAGGTDEAAASAARGVVFIATAKIYFMAAGAAIEFALQSLLGKYGYGAYRLVASAVSTINNVVVTGTVQAVSRQTAAAWKASDGGPARPGSGRLDPVLVDEAKATGLKLHLIVGLGLAALFALGSPLMARFFHDQTKTGPLALAAAIVAGYSFYAVFVGSANGTRAFYKQAGLDITFATLRAAAILGAAALGLGIYGAVGGWVLAVALVLMVAVAWVGPPRRRTAGSIKPMMAYLAEVATYLVLVNLLMTVDSFLLKRLYTERLVAAGTAAALASREADGLLGIYGGVQQIARLPYQLMLAVTFVIFPLTSQATFAHDRERAARYIRTTMRYSLLFATAMGVALGAPARAVLRLPFPVEFALQGGPALSVLALGHVAFALFTIGGTILNSAGLTRQSVLSAGLSLLALVVAQLLVIPRLGVGRPMLFGVALATSGAMVLGALMVGWQLVRAFGVFLPPLSMARTVLACAAGFLACRWLPFHGRLVAPLAGMVVATGVYLLLLVALGELRRSDLLDLTAVARRKKSADGG